ncbi:hypothetical protein DES53_11293 [Roseimicrobium gellanilyticum]|uniref:Lipocalin-like protein n=1 Tax=Roseimicrobium gellanilyticum TaxID=748857 RepID=A0A366H7R9_9BACT|nr:hypothetical protein [Roseimicrobium gellanilyticum]RBP38095.1 hypothetical protein DES53_11293 [Roseimicrobium gellanilyticum]
MKTVLLFLILAVLNCYCAWAYETADIDTIKQQIVGTWLSDAMTNTCERSDKRKSPSSASQIRVTYNPDGTFIGHNIVKQDGKFERNAEFKGTYCLVFADFEGPEVPALFTKVEEVTYRSQSFELDERTLEMIVMDKPATGTKAPKHMIVSLWRRPGSLNPCPWGEVTYSYWAREDSK